MPSGSQAARERARVKRRLIRSGLLPRDGGVLQASAKTAPKKRRLAEEEEEQVGDEAGEEEQEVDTVEQSEYFRVYGQLSIHALMLRDEPRVGAYAAAISANKPLIEGRVVLDVGSGSGLLSMLAAKRGGAARVYAVEAVSSMAQLSRDLIKRNGVEDVVTVVEGKIEEVEIPEKVDVIISEWMGFYLVHESMLDSVLVARDRFLQEGGVMLPESGRIWAALVEAEDFRKEIEGYQSLYGLDFSPIGAAELARRCEEPQVELVEPSRLVSSPSIVVDLGDFRELQQGSTASFESQVAFVSLRKCHAAGVAFWFDVSFGSLSGTTQDLTLSTSPGSPPTHWKQTVVYLGVFVPVEAGEMLEAKISLKQSDENPRQYNITIET